MKKLLFLIIALFFLIGATPPNKNSFNYEEKVEIQRLITYSIGKKLVKFIKENDFSRPYEESYYAPLRDEMAKIVRKYNNEKIFKIENKLKSCQIVIIYPSNKIPKFVAVRLNFLLQLKPPHHYWGLLIKINQERKST